MAKYHRKFSDLVLFFAVDFQASTEQNFELDQLSSISSAQAQLKLIQLSSGSSSAQCITEPAQLTAQQYGKMLSLLMS